MILEAFTFYFLHFLLFYQCLVHTESMWIALPDAERAIRHSAEKRAVLSCVWKDVNNWIISVFTNGDGMTSH